MSKDEGEKCQKCGEYGEDRRTLWMACLYAMNELNVPFSQEAIYGSALEFKGMIKDQWGSRPDFADTSKSEPHQYNFFTLRVCKGCRADWMTAIQNWFNGKSTIDDLPPVNSGIFVRKNGATFEISEEEWCRLNPGRKPVRWR